jgi:hypothetical protein
VDGRILDKSGDADLGLVKESGFVHGKKEIDPANREVDFSWQVDMR